LAFNGSIREHVAYEKYQDVKEDEMLPFNMHESMNISLLDLCRALEERIAKYELSLFQNINSSFSDIPLAVHAATWVASAVYQHAMT